MPLEVQWSTFPAVHDINMSIGGIEEIQGTSAEVFSALAVLGSSVTPKGCGSGNTGILFIGWKGLRLAFIVIIAGCYIRLSHARAFHRVWKDGKGVFVPHHTNDGVKTTHGARVHALAHSNHIELAEGNWLCCQADE